MTLPESYYNFISDLVRSMRGHHFVIRLPYSSLLYFFSGLDRRQRAATTQNFFRQAMKNLNPQLVRAVNVQALKNLHIPILRFDQLKGLSTFS